MPTKDTTIAFHFGLPGCTLLETIARHGFQDEKSIVRHGCQSEINSHHDVRHGFPGCTLLETIMYAMVYQNVFTFCIHRRT